MQRIVSGCPVSTHAGEVCLMPKKVEELNSAKKMLTVALRFIETEDEHTPVKILGFDAGNNVLRAAVGVAASGFVAIAKILLY